MTTPRFGHTATLLNNGLVLVAGGLNTYNFDDSSNQKSAELFDPATGTWAATGDMTTPRFGATATLLEDGRVLVVGGEAVIEQPLDSAEIYDPATGVWTPTSKLIKPRSGHTATLLDDGRVLVAGGVDPHDPIYSTIATAEIFDPNTAKWSAAKPMTRSRSDHSAVLLPDGRVLVAGGSGGESDFETPRSAEAFDPGNGEWRTVADLTHGVSALAILQSGNVLAVGGVGGFGGATASSEYDPKADLWADSPTGPTAVGVLTPLLDGNVLDSGSSTASTSVWLYVPTH